MNRFTVYRKNLSTHDTHNHYQKNSDDEPQFEGVIWTDGTVSVRWLTTCSSWSNWLSIEDMLNIHGHPEYGTEIVWHDGPEPQHWINKKAEYEISKKKI
jgi:hypothetical protein